MKKIALFAVAGLALTGCGISQSKFEDEAKAKGCEILTLCEIDCPSDGGTDSGGEPTCTYDKSLAKGCLDAMDEVIAAGECPDADASEAMNDACKDVLKCE